MGTWFGGGYWRDHKTILLNGWQPEKGEVPFKIEPLQSEFGGEDPGVLYPRWLRDGWRRRGDNYGTDRRVPGFVCRFECDDDDGWQHKPSPAHPTLSVKYVGYLKYGYTFRYELEGYPGLLDEKVDSACWDSQGNLVYSRKGVLYKYRIGDLRSGRSAVIHDLEELAPPAQH
jgi:hypothetical protein